jgi:hypothetical protein
MNFPIIFHTFFEKYYFPYFYYYEQHKKFNNMSLTMLMKISYFIQVKEPKMSIQVKYGQF